MGDVVMAFRARFWWGGIFSRDKIELFTDRVIITRRRFFGLFRTEDEILYKRIASVKLSSGIFTAGITIETGGGTNKGTQIRKLSKKSAKKAIAEIRSKIAE